MDDQRFAGGRGCGRPGRMKANALTEPLVQHGEGPVWDHASWVLYWVDMLAGDLLSRRYVDGVVRRRHVGSVAAAVRPRRGGGLVIALERGFALLDPGTEDPQALDPIWDDPSVRMNDGGCDPQGRFYCGSMAYDEAPGRGRLYQLDSTCRVRVVLEPVTISNGLAWGLDGSTAYYVDSATQRVDAFDFEAAEGRFSNRRPVVEIAGTDGAPDGITVDAEGGIWVALWGGSAVRRYLPDGRLDEVIELPVTQVTACTFGGPDLNELFIMTSRYGVADDDQPLAGAVFVAHPAVRGLPALTYAG
jgi:sugar lactone lactonase YvrE